MMIRLLLLIMAGFTFLACNFPFGEKCACTAMACFEGVSIQLQNNPDSAVYRNFSVVLAYGDTVESVSDSWGREKDRFYFSSGTLRRQKPQRIGIRLAYLENGLAKSLSMDSTAAWSTFVCNRCSGSSSNCGDDMASNANVKVDLGQLL